MQKNSLYVGSLVTMMHPNGVGEGIIWRVTNVFGLGFYVKITPVYAATGQSVLRPKKVSTHMLKEFTIVDLAMARKNLDELIMNYFDKEPKNLV